MDELGQKEFGKLWHDYANAYATLLIEADGVADSRAGIRLARLVHEIGRLKVSLLLRLQLVRPLPLARLVHDTVEVPFTNRLARPSAFMNSGGGWELVMVVGDKTSVHMMDK